MKSQTGAKFLKNQRAASRTRIPVTLNSIKQESKLIELPSGAVKRVR